MVAGTALEDGDLAAPPAQRARYQRDPGGDTGGVDREPGSEIVCAVQHKVAAGDQVCGIGSGQAFSDRFDMNMGVKGLQGLGSGLDLESAGIGPGKQDLALEVGQGDGVVVDEAQGPHARRSQIEGGRRTDASQSDQANARSLQPLLAGAAHFRQQQVARIAFDFVVGEGHPSQLGPDAAKVTHSGGLAHVQKGFGLRSGKARDAGQADACQKRCGVRIQDHRRFHPPRHHRCV